MDLKSCRNLWIYIKSLILNKVGMSINSSHYVKLHFLATVFNKLGNFDMTRFDGRLIFQKTVYFLQAFKIYMGYNFSLYIHGPYSPDLAKDGFELKDKIGQIKDEIQFPSEESKKSFDVFLSFIDKIKDQPDDLETLASLHLFHKLFPTDSKNMIIQRVLYHKPYLQKGTCEESWKILENFGLVQTK